MSVHFLAEISEIADEEMYASYVRQASPIIESYGGEYVLKSDKLTPLSGDWDVIRTILIRFDSVETIKKCFGSEEYTRIKHLRENSIKSKSMIIE